MRNTIKVHVNPRGRGVFTEDFTCDLALVCGDVAVLSRLTFVARGVKLHRSAIDTVVFFQV